ncbi:MAG: cysteine synthase A [Firmicutes bacterium]|nr:cysteine synthase A [Bacillota bacterium]
MRDKKIEQIIGTTPLVKLRRLVNPDMAEVWVKLESHNPAGSVKDRPALYMLNAAEEAGLLPPGGTIIESTSGNTGVALAMLAAARGYRMILVMPETMSVERRKLAQAYGAEIILTPGAAGMQGAVDKARELVAQHGYFMPDQFANQNNVRAHYETTGVEILRDLDKSPDALVAGVGTGGTISGAGRRLKENNSSTLIVAVEPENSPLLSGGNAGSHKIQGLGANFIPPILDRSIIDQVITVKDEDAFATAQKLASQEGILCGISAGANVFAALQLAQKLGTSKTVVTIVPDTGERYLSTPLYSGE